MSDLVAPMGDRPRTLRVLLIDADPIFCAGLRAISEQFSDLEIIAEARTSSAVQEILPLLKAPAIASLPLDLPINFVVLDLKLGLKICQQIKAHYPNLPILVMSSQPNPTQLAGARAIGVNGYCPKGVAVSELIAAMRLIAAGSTYGFETVENRQLATRKIGNYVIILPTVPTNIVGVVRERLRISGLQQIDATLAAVTARLVPGIPLLDKAFLAGNRRELLAARWLVNRLLTAPESRKSTLPAQEVRVQPPPAANQIVISAGGEESALIPSASNAQLQQPLQTNLFETVRIKLESNLQNLTDVPLEIDIFREHKKRELLQVVLRKVEDILDELRFSRVEASQLPEIQLLILRDLWQAATIDFFGRYATLRIGNRSLEIVNLLLRDAVIVQTAILNKIPLVVDLLSYLLFSTPLVIDNVSYAANTPEAAERAEIILQNLLIQVANAVVQPLLNQFADLEVIKQNFYARRLISTREIERFRNNLSWKYRQQRYLGEPTAIFESRYDLFVLVNRGIAKVSIYAPRTQELNQLSGIQQIVTLALELRDAIAPRIRAVVSFTGSGVIYILTQVIGRAIGLIGRGILQGIGATPDGKFGKRK